MIANKLTPKYCKGVNEFIKFTVERTDNSNCIKYSCLRCACADKVTVKALRDHLFINETDQGYLRWI